MRDVDVPVFDQKQFVFKVLITTFGAYIALLVGYAFETDASQAWTHKSRWNVFTG